MSPMREDKTRAGESVVLGLFEFKENQKNGWGNWSVGNVFLLSTRKASAAGERWATGASAKPTVHRPVLWSAQLSTAGASKHPTLSRDRVTSQHGGYVID